jgi:hypothetical protein
MDPFTVFASTFAGRAAVRFGGKKAADQVADLIGLQSEQIKLLKLLDKKVDALLAGPFNTGCRMLQDACAEWRSETDQKALLKEAYTAFSNALGQDTDHLRRSYAALYLAMVWLLLGSLKDAELRLEEAHHEAVVAAREVCTRQFRRAILRRPDRFITGIIAMSRTSVAYRIAETGVPPKSILKTQERAKKRIGNISAYLDALADMREALGRPAEQVPRYTVTGVTVNLDYGPDFSGGDIHYSLDAPQWYWET